MEQFNIPAEFSQPLQSCFELLKKCNLLFFDNRPHFQRIWPYFYMLPCVVLYFIALTIYLIDNFKKGMDLDQLVYLFPVYVVCTQTIFKASIVVLNKKEIEFIILRMGALWRCQELSEVQISKKNVMLRRLNLCYAVFYWMNMLGSWQYIITPLLETIARRLILQQECKLMLPFGCYFPIDVTESWGTYLMAYIFEGYSMFRIVYWYLGTEFLMIIKCSHLATEFTLLQEDLLHLKPNNRDIGYFNNNEYSEHDNKINETVLRNLIRRHQTLIGLSSDLDNIFNKMIFVNLSSATISICFFGFSAKVARDAVDRVNNLLAVIASMLPIFNLCYYGEQLKESSEKIGNSAYTNLWYNGDKSYKMAIWFVMKRSQKPCSLTSLKYNPIALCSFTTVLSTTWSYFSLASSVYNETAKNV